MSDEKAKSQIPINSSGLQVVFLCFVNLRTKVTLCVCLPHVQSVGNATLPLSHKLTKVHYSIAHYAVIKYSDKIVKGGCDNY